MLSTENENTYNLYCELYKNYKINIYKNNIIDYVKNVMLKKS